MLPTRRGCQRQRPAFPRQANAELYGGLGRSTSMWKPSSPSHPRHASAQLFKVRREGSPSRGWWKRKAGDHLAEGQGSARPMVAGRRRAQRTQVLGQRGAAVTPLVSLACSGKRASQAPRNSRSAWPRRRVWSVRFSLNRKLASALTDYPVEVAPCQRPTSTRTEKSENPEGLLRGGFGRSDSDRASLEHP